MQFYLQTHAQVQNHLAKVYLVARSMAKQIKYLGVAFISDGRQGEELNVRLDKVSAVMQALHHAVALKRKLSKNAELSVFKSIFVPMLTYAHESWVMTRESSFNKVNFLVVSLNDALFCKNSGYK